MGEQISPERPVGTAVESLRADSRTLPPSGEERAVRSELASVRTAEGRRGLSPPPTTLQDPVDRTALPLSTGSGVGL